ncbi:MAG: hypothetical protein ACFFDF_13195 [Candidatus Odinarchaeota archaeon]
MSWIPQDNFYPGYSILEDIGTTVEEEKKRVGKILQQDNIDSSDSNIKTYMEISRDLMIFLNNECKQEIQEFSEYIRKEKYVGTTLPIELIFSQTIISEIIVALVVLGIKEGFKKVFKKIKAYFKKRKEEKELQEQTEIILKTMKKIEANGKIIEKLEFSLKTITYIDD